MEKLKIVGKLTANGTNFSGPFFRGNFVAFNSQSCGSDLYQMWERNHLCSQCTLL